MKKLSYLARKPIKRGMPARPQSFLFQWTKSDLAQNAPARFNAALDFEHIERTQLLRHCIWGFIEETEEEMRKAGKRPPPARPKRRNANQK